MSLKSSPSENLYTIPDLKELMQRLRDAKYGCPWDIAQTYSTIAPSTIEEAYEVVDAIERSNFSHLKEELGDLLFQVIFYSQLAMEEGRFTFDDIVSDLVAKLIQRHPHVFPDNSFNNYGQQELSSEEKQIISSRWEELKKQERVAKGQTGILDDIPVNLPALTRAHKLQKRASSVGFDWPDLQGVLQKIEEELEEVKQAIQAQDQQEVKNELGDLLFAVVNACRHSKTEPESALRKTNIKFEQRFRYIEEQLKQRGIEPEDAQLELMDQLWEEAKRE